MREFELLQHVFAANRALPVRVTIPPGDDMGAVRIGDTNVLVTVDQIADGLHFDLATMPLAKIARKAITRNLSDVAAMAAQPVGAVAAVCLPRGFGENKTQELFDQMRAVAESFACPLFGGDISMWDHPLIITVTILAEPVPGIAPVLRQGARVGDVICVTGRLGGSTQTVNGYVQHLDFEPRLTLARKLAGDPATRPHCMIDLSDGLAKDLGHLCRAAGVSAAVDAQSLPVSAAAEALAQTDGQPVWRHAVGDGEDYELCFTVTPAQAANLPVRIEGVPLTQIGAILAGPPTVRVRLPEGQVVGVDDLGWEHCG